MKPATFQWMIHGICASATLLAATIAYALALRPMDGETNELRTTIEAKSEFLAGSEEINARNRELKGNLTKTEVLIDRVKRRIPDAPQEADFLAQLAEAAEKSNVELVDYRPETPVEKENHYELTIRVSATGDYVAICRFLDRIQTLPRLCHVTGMEIDAADLTATTYPIDLTLQVFYSRTTTEIAQNEEDGNG